MVELTAEHGGGEGGGGWGWGAALRGDWMNRTSVDAQTSDAIILGPRDEETTRLRSSFDAKAPRQKNVERLIKKGFKKKRKKVHRLNVLLLRKVKDRACAAVSSPNYLYWSILKAPPASPEPRLCSLKRP